MRFAACTLAAALLGAGPLAAAPASQPPKPVMPHSTFIIPSSPREGCDPFFPNSSRPYEMAMASTHVALITTLSLKGMSGPSGHRLAIINNHTFGEGDEEEVAVPNGKVHVRCLQIRANSVVIEVAGQRRELTFSTNQ